MFSGSIPYKLPQPFAASAGSTYLTNPIPPNANDVTGAAGADYGFPPITSVLPGAGGIPPNINDFNGILYYVSAWAQWQQAGAPVQYDATFSSEIGGYPNGAVIAQGTDPTRQWLSLIDNNTSDPDTGGANWADATIGRLLSRPILLTSSQTISSSIVPAGTRNYMVEIVGGGGAGGYAPATTGTEASVGSGGCSGARVAFWVTGKNPVGDVLLIGLGGTTTGTTAGNGGDSSWQVIVSGGATILAKGGVAGGSSIASPPPTAAGGSYSSGTTGYGAAGVNAYVFSTNSGQAGGTGIVFNTTGTGGGGLGGQQIDFGNGGGGSFGSGAGAATGYGAGGGGGLQGASASGQAGGNGSSGAARLWCYS